jgi:chromosome segregation ATPase
MADHEVDDAPSRDEFAAQRADQDRTLVAMHDVEAALGSAAPGREQEWRQRVGDALEALSTVVADEEANSRAPDSLLSDLERSHPRLRSRVHGVRAQYAGIRETLTGLSQELATATDAVPDFSDMRQRLAWLFSALRHQRARESDLLYEAYRDAFGVDIERDPARPPHEAGARDEPERLTTKRADRARSLDALQQVERRAGAAGPGRADVWLDELRASAYELEVALTREQSDDAELFNDIERAEPRLHNRIVQLRRQYRSLTDAMRDVRKVLDRSEPDTIDVADLRRNLDQLATELRYLRARETDLVYEAYTVDLGAGD